MSTILVFTTVYLRSFTKKGGALTRTKSRGLTQQFSRTFSSGLGLKSVQTAVASVSEPDSSSRHGNVHAGAGHGGNGTVKDAAAAVNGVHEAAVAAENGINKAE